MRTLILTLATSVFKHMKIQLGDILTAENGAFYRVVECEENMISLKRVNGYTSFSCNPAFVEAQFHFVQSLSQVHNRLS